MISQIHIDVLSQNLQIPTKSVLATVELLDQGGTIPFIARYRKEVTNSLDEVQISDIRDGIEKLREFDKRRDYIIKSIEDQNLLTDALRKKINSAKSITELEDLYLPFKPKRRTKATIAKEKGLQPLADIILTQQNINLNEICAQYLSEEKGVPSIEEALQGARDIIAETINEDADSRNLIRKIFKGESVITSKVLKSKIEEGEKYKDYFDFEEKLNKIPSHRLLALRRGEKEMILSLDISIDGETATEKLARLHIQGNNSCAEQIELAIKDSYKRLMKPSIETEFRLDSKNHADLDAIQVFADNLKELLLASPIGRKNVLALDPGFRTGCKVVCLDKQGDLTENAAIYPNAPQNQTQQSAAVILDLVKKHNIEAIAIGNGTAGRETETFVKSIKELPQNILVVMVNESGASIYSASDVAREEFPDKDITVRGAVSIGRRLQDPLSELVKLDPKSIGVGQYQHDVDQNSLKKKLDEIVESCVNAVGVEVNSASKQLLTYVAGLGPTLAQNIINYRTENGPFKSRKELMKVPRMGAKVFEQAAGFLRIRDGKNPLDSSAVHPESYSIVDAIAKNLNIDTKRLIGNPEFKGKINLSDYITDTVGLPTLKDIINELEKPGRDPRSSFEIFQFADGVNSIEDLREGMELPGIVTNVTNFGAFVDIGVHQDGLVHVSQLSDTFITDPKTVVKVQQQVKVRVTEVDVLRKRIGLSMKSNNPVPFKNKQKKAEPAEPEDFNAKLSALKGKWN